MKRWIKNSLLSIGCLGLLSFVIAFSTNWSNKTTISSVGSSGVKPFVEELSKKYLEEHKDLDITVDAGGSGFGIEQVAKGYTDIGNASKDPYNTIVNQRKDDLGILWENNQIKTYTVAWEGICLIYVPPKSIDESINLDTILDINENNIAKLYQAFSGISEGDYANAKPKLSDFIADQSLKDKFDVNITPYVRTGGSMTSGTADAFYTDSRLNFDDSQLSDETKKAFEEGSYGNGWKIYQTDEANSRAWDMFEKSNTPGSVVYLSSGFVQENKDLIEKKGYGIFSYNGVPFFQDNQSKLNEGYNWCRPLNLMCSIEEKNEVDFILWLLDLDASEWKNIGGAALSEKQKESMGNLTTDFDIKLKQQGNTWFGAKYGN